jgi:two-component system OmpR family sensor kinase
MPHQPIPGQQPPGEHPEELLAMVAHELRQPLTALRGALMTLQHRTQALSRSQQQELLGMANRQGEQLQRLLDQLLAAASVDHGHAHSPRRSQVDAAALAEEAGQAARLAHPNHPITIEAAGPLPVRVDPLAITRILGNLLDNAAAHCPPGSLIRLIGGRDGTQAVVAVQDQGPGIPADARERIFEPYARGARHAEPAAGGLGLGLYIARRLAHANHGQLYVTDHPAGHGARLELRLPLASPVDRAPQTSIGDGDETP